MLALAEVLFSIMRRAEALSFVERAQAIYEKLGSYRGAAGEAKAARLFIKILLIDEKVEEALALPNRLVTKFRNHGHRRAEALAQLALSDAQLAADRPRTALSSASAALEAFRTLEDEPWAASALQAQASAQMRLEKPQVALKLLGEALEAVRQVGDSKEEAAVLLAMSKAHTAMQHSQEACDAALQSLGCSQTAGNRSGELAALEEVANLITPTEEVLEHVQCALVAAAEAGDPAGEVSMRRVAGLLLLGMQRHKEALEVTEPALVLARELGDWDVLGTVLDVRVSILVSEGAVDKAVMQVQNEVLLAESLDDNRREVAMLVRLARLQIAPEVNEPGLGLHNLEKATRQAAGDKPRLVSVFLFKADILHATGDIVEAKKAARCARTMAGFGGGTQPLVASLQLLADLHWETGDTSEVHKALSAQLLAYQTVGWRDKEAQSLLALADHSARVSETKEAARLAKRAVEMFQTLDDADNEAQATLALAIYQGSSPEGMKTADDASTLFRKLGNAAMEAQALLTLADGFLAGGKFAVAVARARRAQEICRKTGETRIEAEALQALASVYVSWCQRIGADTSHMRTRLRDGLEAVSQWVKVSKQSGSLVEHVNALNQASTLRMMNKEFSAGLTAAEEAMRRMLELEVPVPELEAVTFTTLAEAHLNMQHGAQAKEAAQSAQACFERLGDRSGCETARQIVQAAEVLTMGGAPAPEPPPPALSAEPEPEAVPGRGARWRDSFQKESVDPPQQQPDQEVRNGKKQPDPEEVQKKQIFKSTFTSLATEAATQQSDQEMQKHSGVPDQRKRRRQLMAASKAQAKHAAEVATNLPADAPAPLLVETLSALRPEFSLRDLQNAKEKLASIDIHSSEDLCRELSEGGSFSVNAKLKANGKRSIRADTLDRFLEYHRSRKAGV